MNARSTPVCTGLRSGASANIDSEGLVEGWTLTSTPPGACSDPSGLGPDLAWRDAIVPGTVALVVGPEDLDRHEEYDERDWWYRCSFDASGDASADRVALRFDGLATLAEVWLNGERILDATNMFEAHRLDVTDLVRPHNALAICFRSVTASLAARRPRPRWKTKLVRNQQLRWLRTTLLGRIPGWTPAISPVGPWRPVWLERVRGFDLSTWQLRSGLVDGNGTVRLEGTVGALATDWSMTSGTLTVAGHSTHLDIVREGDGWAFSGSLVVPDPELWWPRTHGEPTLHRCKVDFVTSHGTVSIDCGRVGFRSIDIDRSNGAIQFVVNGVPVFCRGACWTTNDIRSLVGAPSDMQRTLSLAADGNANMIRIGGTMVYESDAFYETCDELGLMVWQDFMFANMDYPVDDAAFLASVTSEAEQQLHRLGPHACMAAYCGGSEVEQQAAMFGADRSVWTSAWFSEALPRLVESISGSVSYWSSTPTGGTLPFQIDEGLTHYYGVGAYRRGVEDARLSRVKFSPECLGFSNVPEDGNLRKLSQGGTPAPHDPAWKAGVPRDSGAGWDFEDVRDHYLKVLYAVDPVVLRSHDRDGYLNRARVVTGRIMSVVFDEWRSPEHPCGGGLVWFLNDLRPGAGWGLIDSDGMPKAAYYQLKRAWAPVRVALLDRGLDGVRVEVHNESGADVEARLEVSLLGHGSNVLSRREVAVTIEARSAWNGSVEGILGHFADPAYAYRFGPLGHAAVYARLVFDESTSAPPRRSSSLDCLYWPALDQSLLPVTLEGTVGEAGAVGSIQAAGLARDVRVDVAGVPSDNYFDLPPGSPRSFDIDGGSETHRTPYAWAENAPGGSGLRS